MVSSGLHLASGPEPDLEHLLDPAGEGVGEHPGHQVEALVQGPDRDVARAGGKQFAQRDLAAGVGPQDPGVRGEAARFTQVGEQGLLVGALLGAAVQLGTGRTSVT